MCELKLVLQHSLHQPIPNQFRLVHACHTLPIFNLGSARTCMLCTWKATCLQGMVRGLQQIDQQNKCSTAHTPSNVMAELKAAGLLQRKLFLFMLATQDASQEAAVRSAVLHTSMVNLQQPWQLVQQTHEDMLVGCPTALSV